MNRSRRFVNDDSVEAIWIATPTQLHAEHVRIATEHGKHVAVEKPFAVSLEECQAMIDAAERNEVSLIAAGARSFDPAFVAMREIVDSGRLGRLGALTTWSHTGWIIRPREPYEVDVALGGGTIFNQAPHQVDVLRLLGGGACEERARRHCHVDERASMPGVLHGDPRIRGWHARDDVVQRPRLRPRVGVSPVG